MLLLEGKGKGAGAGPAPSGAEADDELDLDDELGAFDDELGGAPVEDDEPSVAFSMAAEVALGTSEPAKVRALRDAIRAVLDEGEALPPPLPPEGEPL